MSDVTTSLQALLKRSQNASVDGIAKEGVSALKRVIDRSGFAHSPYLKGYQVFAHVTGGQITFEIRLASGAVVPVDVTAQKDMERQQQLQNNLNAVKDIASKRYGLTDRGVQKTYNDSRRDALKRTPSALRSQKPATRPTKNALKNSEDRLVGHEIAYHAPRSMNLTKDGKIAISFRRSIRETKDSSFHFPKNKYEGIPHNFLNELQSVVGKAFRSHLIEIMKGNST